MDLKESLNVLESSSLFAKWKNKETYFSYAFRIPQESNEGWHLGFYDRNKDKITTFIIKKEDIEVRNEEDVFKEDEREVGEIEIKNIKLNFDEIIKKASDFQQKNFPKDRPIKTIAILQHLKKIGDVWNITFVTEAFNTLNMKICPTEGKIIEHNISSIFSFRKK